MPSKPVTRGAAPGIVLGAKRFARISAVEGIELPHESQRMFREMDRRGLSPDEQAAYIALKHAPRTLHVVRFKDGWAIRSATARRAITEHATELQAIEHARAVAKTYGKDFVVHGRDGRIQDRETYAADPVPRRRVKR